jgi:hypothetical protein
MNIVTSSLLWNAFNFFNCKFIFDFEFFLLWWHCLDPIITKNQAVRKKIYKRRNSFIKYINRNNLKTKVTHHEIWETFSVLNSTLFDLK